MFRPCLSPASFLSRLAGSSTHLPLLLLLLLLLLTAHTPSCTSRTPKATTMHASQTRDIGDSSLMVRLLQMLTANTSTSSSSPYITISFLDTQSNISRRPRDTSSVALQRRWSSLLPHHGGGREIDTRPQHLRCSFGRHGDHAWPQQGPRQRTTNGSQTRVSAERSDCSDGYPRYMKVIMCFFSL